MTINIFLYGLHNDFVDYGKSISQNAIRHLLVFPLPQKDVYQNIAMLNNTVSSGTKRSDYLKWEQYFMAMAFISGQRSKDPDCQVGACIVNSDKRIVGLGYNGMPNNCSDDEFPWGKGATTEDNKHLYVCCAELNAIVNKIQADIRGSEIYVTRFPCNQCAKIIVQSRLKKVTYYHDKGFSEEKEQASKKILEANKVEIIKYEPKDGVSLKVGNSEEFML